MPDPGLKKAFSMKKELKALFTIIVSPAAAFAWLCVLILGMLCFGPPVKKEQ